MVKDPKSQIIIKALLIIQDTFKLSRFELILAKLETLLETLEHAASLYPSLETLLAGVTDICLLLSQLPIQPSPIAESHKFLQKIHQILLDQIHLTLDQPSLQNQTLTN